MIQQLKHLFDIRLLYFLLPISLGSGPFFPDLIVVIFSIILIIQTIKKNIFYNLINPLSIFFTLFYCYLLIASYFSDNFIFSLESSLFYFRYILFFLAFSLFFNDTNKRFFFYGLLVLFFIISFHSFLQYFHLDKFFFGEHNFYKPPNRFHLPYSDELVVGSMFVRLLPIFIVVGLYLDINKYVLFGFGFVTAIVIILSGERAPLALLILSIILIFLKFDFNSFSKIFYLCTSILSIFLIIYFIPITKDRYIDETLRDFYLQTSDKQIFKFNKDFSFLNEKKNIYIFSEAHTQHYIIAYDMFTKDKMTGQGPKSFRLKCKDEIYNKYYFGCTTHPHNTYFQLIAETGIIGLFTFLMFYIYCIKSYFKGKLNISLYKCKNNKKILLIISIIMIIVNFFPFLPSGNFFNNWLNVFYFLPIAILNYSYFQKND